MSKVKYFFEQSWLLLVSAVIFGGLLAVTNAAWGPRIRQNEIDKFNRLAGGMLTGARNFQALEQTILVDPGKGKTYEVEVKKGLDEGGNLIGWAFVCEGSGFADKIKLVVATDAAFEKMAGFGVLSSNETPGFGDKINKQGEGSFQSQFSGVPAETLELTKAGDAGVIDSQIVAISGATVTSQAVVDTLNAFLLPLKEALADKGMLENGQE